MADNVVEILVKSKNSTRAGFSGAKADAEAAATGIAAVFDRMGQRINQHLGAIGKGLGKTGAGGAGVAGVFAGAGGLLSMAGPLAAAAAAMGAFGAVAIPVLSKVSQAQGTLTTAQAAYNKVVFNEQVALSQAGLTAKQKASIEASFSKQKQQALYAESQATAGLTSQQKGLLGPLQQIKTAFTQLQNIATPALGSLLKLGASLMPVFGGLVRAGGQVVQAIAVPLAKFFQTTTTIGVAGSDKIKTVLTPFGQFLKVLQSLAVQAGPVFAAFLMQIIKLFMQLTTTLGPVGLQLLKVLLPAIVQLAAALVPFLLAGAKLVLILSQWLEKNKLLVPVLAAVLVGFLAFKLGMVAGLQAIGKAIWAAMGPWSLLAAAVLVAVLLIIKYHRQIWEFITRIWGDIFGFLRRTWNAILDFAKRWWPLLLGPSGLIVMYHQQVFGFIQRIWGDIVRFFAGLPGRIIGALSSLGRLLYNLARDAMQSLWNGAKSLWNSVISFFKNLGHSIISGILHILNPFSDSGPFFRIGSASMDDLLKGLKSRAGHVLSWMQHMASSVIGHLLPGGGGGIGAIGSGVQQWAGLVSKALAMLGEPQLLMGRVLYQMQTESGGNPRAINLTDINAQLGHPSMGLMQVIDSTFQKYAGPLLQRGVWDPLANIYAAINYAMHVYGPSLMNSRGQGIGSGHGYDTGGWLPPGVSLAVNRTGRPERVIGPGGITVVLQVGGSGSSGLDSLFLTWLRRTVRVQGGGSVQVAFGS